jgi:uncharacterized membrane protein
MANFYEKLHSSYGFIPSVMAIMAGILASLLVYLDLLYEENRLIELSWINFTGAAGARAILSTVAESILVTNIIAGVSRDLSSCIERLFPEKTRPGLFRQELTIPLPRFPVSIISESPSATWR